MDRAAVSVMRYTLPLATTGGENLVRAFMASAAVPLEVHKTCVHPGPRHVRVGNQFRSWVEVSTPVHLILIYEALRNVIATGFPRFQDQISLILSIQDMFSFVTSICSLTLSSRWL